jgi:nitrogen regulatory protein PII
MNNECGSSVRYHLNPQTPMEKIEAIIKPFKMDEVKENLTAIGINGATITEVRVQGSQKRKPEDYRGSTYWFDFHPMIKLEVVVADQQKGDAIAAILRVAKTGKPGNGKIFVLPIDEAIRIRTEEHGVNAV